MHLLVSIALAKMLQYLLQYAQKITKLKLLKLLFPLFIYLRKNSSFTIVRMAVVTGIALEFMITLANFKKGNRTEHTIQGLGYNLKHIFTIVSS